MNGPAGFEKAPDGAAWLDGFPAKDGVTLISENRPFQHNEADYDSQYYNQDSNESGTGIVNLLRQVKCDFRGPILELGCGTGVATLGLCKAAESPWLLITDASTAFIEIVRKKMMHRGMDLGRVRFAVLSDADLDRLPPQSVSAIVLRSVVHHFLDVPGWIRSAARLLRPGGAIVCEEPCASGYLNMGLIAQAVAENEANGLWAEQRAQARLLADTMKAYNRRDMDKSQWEDKHLFRPEEMAEWTDAAGLHLTFIPNAAFETFATRHEGELPKTDFPEFFRNYLHYCMNFGPESAARIAQAALPLCRWVAEACAGTREPHLMGIFVMRKPQESVFERKRSGAQAPPGPSH
jgi:ubiquinone/menaquinone biosynthesis C-methylase UbiE